MRAGVGVTPVLHCTNSLSVPSSHSKTLFFSAFSYILALSHDFCVQSLVLGSPMFSFSCQSSPALCVLAAAFPVLRPCLANAQNSSSCLAGPVGYLMPGRKQIYFNIVSLCGGAEVTVLTLGLGAEAKAKTLPYFHKVL